MPRFAANISTLFTDRPLPDRFTAARAAGFRAVEMQFPYDHDPGELARARADADVAVALINAPPGDMAAGERGFAALPGREPEFRESVAEARRYAATLGAPLVHCLAGIPGRDQDPETCLDTLAANLRWAAGTLGEAGIRPTLEAINDRDMPGFFVSTSRGALAAIERAGHPAVGFQLDLYHMRIMEGRLDDTLARAAPRLAHIQFADTPGRHEPGTGAIDFAPLFDAIDAMGYDGWVGAEYTPTRPTEETLAWFAPYRA